MRIFEEAAFEAFLVPAGSHAHYAGKQPNASVEQDERTQAEQERHDDHRGRIRAGHGGDPPSPPWRAGRPGRQPIDQEMLTVTET